MNRSEAKMILWAPDMHELPEVAEAAEAVLSAPSGDFNSMDVHQATYLLTTFARSCQYVSPGTEEAASGRL